MLVSLLADAWGWSLFFRTVVAALPALPRCSAPLWVRESGKGLCALRRAAWAAWLRGRACAVQVEVVAAPLAAPASRRPCWAVDEGLRLLPSVSPVGWQGFWSQGFARGRLFFRAARGGSQPSRGGFSGLWAPCPARDRRTRVLEGRRRGGLNRSSKGHSAGCWFVSVQEPGAAAVVGRGGGGALYAPDLPTLGASGREGRSFSLVRCSAAARHHTRTGMPNEACLSEQTS